MVLNIHGNWRFEPFGYSEWFVICRKGEVIMEDRFCEECDCELAEYEYNGEAYWHECLLNKLEEEKKIQSWSTTHYITEDTDRSSVD